MDNDEREWKQNLNIVSVKASPAKLEKTVKKLSKLRYPGIWELASDAGMRLAAADYFLRLIDRDDVCTIIACIIDENNPFCMGYKTLEILYIADVGPTYKTSYMVKTFLLKTLGKHSDKKFVTKISIAKPDLLKVFENTKNPLKKLYKPPLYSEFNRDADFVWFASPPAQKYLNATICLFDHALEAVAAAGDLKLLIDLCGTENLAQEINISQSTTGDFFETLRSLMENGTEKMILYYCGHSVNAESSDFPVLQFSKNGELSREQIHKFISEQLKIPAIFVWDSCNNLVTRSSTSDVANPGIGPLDHIWDFNGHLYIRSCSPGEEAVVRIAGGGGLFSQNFLSSLRARRGDWIGAFDDTVNLLKVELSNPDYQGKKMTPHYHEFKFGSASSPGSLNGSLSI